LGFPQTQFFEEISPILGEGNQTKASVQRDASQEIQRRMTLARRCGSSPLLHLANSQVAILVWIETGIASRTKPKSSSLRRGVNRNLREFARSRDYEFSPPSRGCG
jgi:hypothetical protein